MSLCTQAPFYKALILALLFSGIEISAQVTPLVSQEGESNVVAEETRSFRPRHGETNLRAILYQENGRFGFLNPDSSIRIQALYNQLPPEPHSIMVVKKGTFQGVIDQAGKVLIPFGAYDKLELQNHQIDHISEDGTTWLKDEDKIPIIAHKDGRLGLVNPFGKHISPLEFSLLSCINHHFYAAFKDGQWKILDGAGKLAYPDSFDMVQGAINNRIVWVGKNGKAGLIELPDKLLLPIVYDEVKPVNQQGDYTVVKGQMVGTFNTKTKAITPGASGYQVVLDTIPIDGKKVPYYLLEQKNTRKYGLGHVEKGLLIPVVCDYIFAQAQCRWFVAVVANKKAIFDSSGQRLCDYYYDVIAEVSENPALAVARQGDKSLLLNISDGQPATKEKYARIIGLNNGYFNFYDGNADALGDPSGKRLTEHKYYSLYPASEPLKQSMKTALKPGRTLIATGMIESGATVGIDDMGEEYNL